MDMSIVMMPQIAYEEHCGISTIIIVYGNAVNSFTKQLRHRTKEGLLTFEVSVLSFSIRHIVFSVVM